MERFVMTVDETLLPKFAAAQERHQRVDRGGGGGLAPPPSGPHDGDMEARVAVLEQIAKETSSALAEIKGDVKAMRTELLAKADGSAVKTEAVRAELGARIQGVDERLRGDTRWLLATMAAAFLMLAGIMAKGFRWF